MANTVDPCQTAPIGTVCSGWVHTVCFYTLFVSNVRQLFAADDFSRRHFQMHFFLGALSYHSFSQQTMIYLIGHVVLLIDVPACD